MGFVSASTLIRSLSIFHITIGYYLLTSPRTIAEQNLVFLFGEAMKLPHTTALNAPSHLSAFLGLIFILLGLSDLTAASLRIDISEEYWASITPIRLIVFFTVAGYTYLFKPDGPLGSGTKGAGFSGTTRGGLGGTYVPSTAGAGSQIQNSLVFTWAFVELSSWFWVFVALRDDRRQRAVEYLERQKREQDHL